MKRTKKADVQLLAFGMLLALVYAVAKLFIEYWYIVLGIVAIIGLIVILGRQAESEVATSEEVREIEPQLPPMPYAESKDFLDYEKLYSVTDYRTRSLLNVQVDETFDEKNCTELEKDVKHDYLMALVENFDPDALIGRGGGQDVYPFCKWKWRNESRSGNSEINPLIEGIFLSR